MRTLKEASIVLLRPHDHTQQNTLRTVLKGTDTAIAQQLTLPDDAGIIGFVRLRRRNEQPTSEAPIVFINPQAVFPEIATIHGKLVEVTVVQTNEGSYHTLRRGIDRITFTSDEERHKFIESLTKAA